MDLPLPNLWEIHPILLHFPIALLLSGVAGDLWAAWRPRETTRRAAAGMLLAGMITGWLTAAAGLLAFYTVPAHTEQAHTWMLWHLGFAITTILLFTRVSVARWRHREWPAPVGLRVVGILAALLLTVTGYLGGSIVYHGGAGVEEHLLAERLREGHSHGGEKSDSSSHEEAGGDTHRHGSGSHHGEQ